jgi:hypothetical protein
MKHNIFLTSILLFAVAACSELKKVDEMHDATVKMSDTTEDMKKSTGDLKDATDELYDALRQGNALQLRREAYNEVMKAPTMFKKISEATKYFMSFEFQLWNGIGQDTALVKRDVLGQQAAQEFFMEVEELAARDNSVDPLAQPNAKDISSEENRAAAFNAMAIAMDQMNRKQPDNIEKLKNDKLITMYSMVEEALQAPREYAQTGYVREILAHEDKAVQLLQARYNMFPLMFIDMMTHLGDKNIFSQAKTLLLGWELDTSVMSATQTEYLRTEVLAKGLAAKELLIKIGRKPELDSKVSRLIEKMTVKNGTAKTSFAEAEQQQQLVNMLKEFRK